MSVNPSEAGISHNPNPGRIERRTERIPALEELAEMDRVWWGPDLKCAHNTLIVPRKTTDVELTFTRDSLPPIDIPERHVETVVQALELDLRSKLAHLGAQEKAKKPRTVDLERGIVTIGVMGLGGRPVELPKDEGLGCFFSIGGNADYLQGVELVTKAAALIKGDFGDAWRLVVPKRMPISKNLTHMSSATAVALMLNKKVRYQIAQSDIPVSYPAGEKDYRKYLKDHQILQLIGKRQSPPYFWVGETLAKVDLKQNKRIVGVLGVMAFVNRQWVFQTESRLIKPAEETPGWKIRHEFYSKPKEILEETEEPEEITEDPYGLGTQYVVMYLIQQPQTAISG